MPDHATGPGGDWPIIAPIGQWRLSAQGRKQQAAAQQRDASEQDHQKTAGNPINGTHNATPPMEAVTLRIS